MMQQLGAHSCDDCRLSREFTFKWVVSVSLASDGHQQWQEGKQRLEV